MCERTCNLNISSLTENLNVHKHGIKLCYTDLAPIYQGVTFSEIKLLHESSFFVNRTIRKFVLQDHSKLTETMDTGHCLLNGRKRARIVV